MRILFVAVSLLAAGAADSSALPSDQAAAVLVKDARAAGARRVAVAAFDGAERRGSSERAAVRDFLEKLASDGRLSLVGLGRSADAVLVGTVASDEGAPIVLARIVDARTGVILAAAEAEPARRPVEPTPYARRLEGARRLAARASAYGPERREAEDRLTSTLALPGGADLRAEAALALGRLGGARALVALRRAEEDPDPNVRSAAILALGLSGDRAAAARVEWTARVDADPRVRDAAALALASR